MITEAAMPGLPPLDRPEFALGRTALTLAFIEHKAGPGPETALASDQDILDRVDDNMAILMAGTARAWRTRSTEFLPRYAWFVDLLSRLIEREPGKPFHG